MESGVNVKPTWEIIQFNDGKEGIHNPKDKNCSYMFSRHISSILYEMVIGPCLVYRRFALENVGEKPFNLSSAEEECRYVFFQDKAYQEDSNCTRRLISVENIDLDGLYDTIHDANSIFTISLYKSFVHDVKILHKSEIINALSHLPSKYPKLFLEGFVEIYKKAFEKSEIYPDTPKRIIKELHNRKHEPHKSIKIDKDLVVVTGEKENEYIDCNDETRAYFDKNNVYYFERNAVSGEWKSEDFWKNVGPYKNIIHRSVDKDIFANTCAEKYIKYSLDKRFPTKSKINLCLLMAEKEYLCVEQAAKIDSPVLEPVLNSIYAGKLHNKDKKLSEVLGISGAQIKLLDNIEIPEDIEAFARCINDEEFVSVYPDIKKRLYAASFYCNNHNQWSTDRKITKEEVLKASQTIIALERLKKENRYWFEYEYLDYIVMLRRYLRYIEQMEENSPLSEEIKKYGDFPLNIKPSRISDCHNKLWRAVSIISSEKIIENHSRAIEKRFEKESKKTEYSNGTYSIVMPKNALDIIREGRELEHCVAQAGYIGAMAQGKTTILFLRENKSINKPLLTIEVKNGCLRQCYGLHDSYNHNTKIRDFIRDYSSRHNLEIKAVIYAEGEQS